MTNVISGSSSIRNRTSRLSSRMKSVKEADDDSGSPRVTATSTAKSVLASTESGMAPDNPTIPQPPVTTAEDSSSSMDELGHQKLKQREQHPLPPVQVPQYRRNQLEHRHHHQQQQQQSRTTGIESKDNNHRIPHNTAAAAAHWGKNIEEGISGILKRLDELSMARENGTMAYSIHFAPIPNLILRLDSSGSPKETSFSSRFIAAQLLCQGHVHKANHYLVYSELRTEGRYNRPISI